MINFAKYRATYFLFSLVLIAAGLAALFLGPGLSFSIEFSSGAAVDATFVNATEQEDVDLAIESLGYEGAVVQGFGDREYFLRLPLADASERQQLDVRNALEEYAGPLQGYSFDLVSPAVARETVRNGLIAVLIAVVGILGYIVYAFRSIRHPFRYGIAAIIALVHDIAVAFAMAGLFMLVGSQWLHLEISSMFLVGVLTLLGYSINDTIVIFDRIRENILRDTNRDIVATTNYSIMESMGRSINTSFTTLVVLLALFLLGPATIRDFLFVMIIGVVSGTYSSIFTASQVIVSWETRSFGSLPFIGGGRGGSTPSAAPSTSAS